MAKVAGVDVLVYVETAPLTFTVAGGQTGATLNRSVETYETTSKSSNGWVEQDYGFKSWGIECEGFIIESDVALGELEDAWLNKTKVKMEVRMPSGKKYSGMALITEFPIDAPQDDAATYKMTFVGDGALTVTPAV